MQDFVIVQGHAKSLAPVPGSETALHDALQSVVTQLQQRIAVLEEEKDELCSQIEKWREDNKTADGGAGSDDDEAGIR